METYIAKDILEQSLLLKATFIFQWIFAIIGISIPPCIVRNANSTPKRVQLLLFGFVLYALLLTVFVFWIVYTNNVVVDVVVYNYDLDSITSVLSTSVNITVAIVQFITLLMAIIKCNCLTNIFKTIAQLEQDINLYFRDYQWLGGDEADLSFQQRCQTFSRKLLIRFGFFSIVLAILVCYVNYYLVADIMRFWVKLLTILCGLTLQIKTIEYCIIIHITDEFLRALLNSLIGLKCEIIKTERNSLLVGLYHGKLMANQILLNRIWLLVRNIEEFFSVPMLILYLYNGIVITHTINWTYVRTFDYSETDSFRLFRLYYLTITFIIMLLPCWLTQSCIDKYNQFGPILHNIKTNDSFDLSLSLHVREYSLQLKHQELLFTCSGFFDINLKYFGLMILSISTYVAILIQFKLQKETEKANVRL